MIAHSNNKTDGLHLDCPGLKNAFAQWLLLCLVLSIGCAKPAPPKTTAETGEAAPDFVLTTLSGDEISSQNPDGKPVILSFWATWCTSCAKEVPELNKLAELPSLTVIGVTLDDPGDTNDEALKAVAEKRGINYSLARGSQELFEQFGGRTIPHTVVLDDAGTVIRIFRGQLVSDEIEALFKPADTNDTVTVVHPESRSHSTDFENSLSDSRPSFSNEHKS